MKLLSSFALNMVKRLKLNAGIPIAKGVVVELVTHLFTAIRTLQGHRAREVALRRLCSRRPLHSAAAGGLTGLPRGLSLRHLAVEEDDYGNTAIAHFCGNSCGRCRSAAHKISALRLCTRLDSREPRFLLGQQKS